VIFFPALGLAARSLTFPTKLRLVTFVPPSSELFRAAPVCCKLFSGLQMQRTRLKADRRRQDRIHAVLPVRVRGTDGYGASFEGLAHTLDLTPTGVRLGAIRRQLKVLDTLTILYHQHRMEFTVVWTRLLDGSSEYQVGLQAFSQEKEPWGTGIFNFSSQPLTRASAISGAA
jgi:hypothetical protein